MPKGNTAALQTLDNILNHDAIVTPPTGSGTIYAALYVSDPGGGDDGIEVAYTGYARQTVSWNLIAVVDGHMQTNNTNLIQFPTLPADAGMVSYIALRTALTAGTLLYYGPLDTEYDLEAGDVPTIPIGDLVVYEE